MSGNASKKNKITLNDFVGDKNGKAVFFITIGLMVAIIVMAIIGITCTGADNTNYDNNTAITTTTQPKTKEDLLEDFMQNAGDYNAAVSSYMSENGGTTTAPESVPTSAAQ